MIVNTIRIEMRGDYDLEILFQQFSGKFHAYPVRQIRRNFARRKALHQMKPLNAVLLVPHLFHPAHIGKGCFTGAANR